jgi:succinoglycan biosynthesis transport protein ExoP
MPQVNLPPAPPLTFRDLAEVMWRRRAGALIAATIATAIVIWATSRVTPLYEAETALTVERGRQAVDFAANPEFGQIEIGLLNTQRELLLSTPVLERAYASGAFAGSPLYEEGDPVALLRKRLKVATDRESWVIKVTLRDEDRDRARAGLAAVTDAFLAVEAKRISGRTRGAVDFLGKQVEVAREALETVRAEEKAFRREHAIQSTDADSNHLALRLNGMISQRIDLQRQLAAAQAQVDQIQQARSLSDAAQRRLALLKVPAIGGNALVVEQQQQLYALQSQKEQLAQTYLAKHPRMLEIESQLVGKAQQLDEAQAIAVESGLTLAQTLAFQLKDTDERIARTEGELSTYRSDLLTLAALGADIASRQNMHDQLLNRLREEEVASRLEAHPVSVMNPARAGSAPANVSHGMFLGLAVLAGLITAAATALALESLDRRVRGPDQIADLTGLPVLGAVPRVADLGVLGRGGDPAQPPVLAEAYRGLRTAIHLSSRQDGCRCLVVTSSTPGEGKSTVATRLAISLAAAGSRVLLVDADMRKPTLHHQIGEHGERGLSFLLAGYTGIEPQGTSYANLDFLGVGVRPPNPGELLHSPGMSWLIERSRSQYQYIVIDTPPLGEAADALVVSEHADGIVLVVRDRMTVKSALRAALARAIPIRSKLLGVVVNADGTPVPASSYALSPAAA